MPAAVAAAHVDAIRKQVAAAIPNKEIMIGEVGWPSAGRMREGALPSPSNQARVIGETLALAQRENFRVNVIEAFDQPWKRWLEGATGGYWGIFDRATGSAEIQLRRRRYPIIRIGCCRRSPALCSPASPFAAAWYRRPRQNCAAAVVAADRGTGFPARRPVRLDASRRVPVDSYTAGTWLRSLAFAATAAAAPIVCAAACAAGRDAPTFAALLSRSGEPRDGIESSRSA